MMSRRRGSSVLSIAASASAVTSSKVLMIIAPPAALLSGWQEVSVEAEPCLHESDALAQVRLYVRTCMHRRREGLERRWSFVSVCAQGPQLLDVADPVVCAHENAMRIAHRPDRGCRVGDA